MAFGNRRTCLSGFPAEIRPGKKITEDRVLEGAGSDDESMIPGEPIPDQKQAGNKLIGAAVNGTGSLVMAAERGGD